MPDIVVPYNVPYVCQFASRELVQNFINKTQSLETDPRWAHYGAATPQEYAHWALRSCGVVCVKMAVDGLSGADSGSVMDWVKKGLAIDGYLTGVRPDRPDQRVEYGWKHDALAQLAINAGYRAVLASDLKIDDTKNITNAGSLLIASVSSQLGELDAPVTRSSGHLVVILGVSANDTGQATHVILHNPSGRTQVMQETAQIPVERFRVGFSGRGIIVSG